MESLGTEARMEPRNHRQALFTFLPFYPFTFLPFYLFWTILPKKSKNGSKSPKIKGETGKWLGPCFVNKYKLTIRRPVIVR
jgi:hypothetical protein